MLSHTEGKSTLEIIVQLLPKAKVLQSVFMFPQSSSVESLASDIMVTDKA